jgi:hypothetical protein
MAADTITRIEGGGGHGGISSSTANRCREGLVATTVGDGRRLFISIRTDRDLVGGDS